MLLFNVRKLSASSSMSFISIHPMLLFNFIIVLKNEREKEFQYIQCYYLTVITRFISTKILTISIHPMLLFNNKTKASQIKASVFQYIQCYYLTARILRAIKRKDLFQYIQCYYLTVNALTHVP